VRAPYRNFAWFCVGRCGLFSCPEIPDAADAHFCVSAGAILGCLLSQFVN
jgi:hypothetical protein